MDRPNDTRLGEVLVLLHGARNRYRTVRAVIRSWHHHERRRRAFARHSEEMRAAGAGVSRTEFARRGDGRPQPAASASLLRLWWAPPDRLREDRESLDGESGVGMSITDAERWWHLGVDGTFHSYEQMPGARSGMRQPSVDHLLDPAPLLAGCDVELLGEARQAGRDALRVRLLPRPAADPILQPPLLGQGADEFEVLVDAERGVLLRVAARIAGEDFRLEEVIEIAFDEAFPEETFRFAAPEVVRVVPAPPIPPPPSAFGRSRWVPLDQAAREAPFTVLVPTRIPQGAELRVNLVPPAPYVVATVTLTYFLPGATHSLNVIEMPADSGVREDLPERRLEHAGREHFLLERDVPGAHVRVRFVQEGTDVRIDSDLPLETILDIAASFVVAATAPPELTGGSS